VIDRQSWGNAVTTAVGLAVLLAAAGCEDDRHVTFPASASGTIRGTVSDGAPLDAADVTVIVRSVSNTEPRYELRAHPDADGTFAFTVPNGPAFVSVYGYCTDTYYYAADGPVERSSAADTIQVAGEVYQVDFAFGRVTLDVGLPPDLPEDVLACALVELGQPLSYYSYGCGYPAEDRLLAEMRLVRPGRYLAALGSSRVGNVYLPATLDSTAAEVLTVTAGQETRHTSELPALARVSGSVTGSWQEIAQDRPQVEIWRETRKYCGADVAADGSFDLPLLLGGPVRLVVWVEAVPAYVGGVDLASATVFDLASGEHLTGISRVESGLELEFAGYSPFDGSYTIRIYDAAGHDLTRRPDGGGGINQNDRVVALCNLPAGEVFVSVTPNNNRALWMPQFYDRRDSLAVADPIVVPPDGQVVPAMITLVNGGCIRGRLLGGDGLPPAGGFELRVYRAHDPEPMLEGLGSWDVSYDAETGAYAIHQLPNGAYKVRGRLSYGLWRYWPGVESFEEAGVVTIANLGEVTGIDLTFPY